MMNRQLQNEYTPTEVSPPGDTLQEMLDDRGMTQAGLALRMGRPKKTVNEIVKGKASITPETALELELVLGAPSSFWNSRESNYRAYLARREQEARFEKDLDWLRAFPVSALVKSGRIQRHSDKKVQLRELLAFFGVASPEQWRDSVERYRAAFRKSAAFESNNEALTAWLRSGVIDAEEIHCGTYDRQLFIEALQTVRGLTTESPEVFQPAMSELCARAGVAVVLVPQLPKARASGATRWLTPKKALIQLSIRHKTDDHFWFTFFHEAAHILLHGKRLIFLETSEHTGHLEEQANAWAAEFMIDPGDFAEFIATTGTISKAKIRAFASAIGISPGIVVGRLQHEEVLPYTHCNDLKIRFKWADGPE